MELFLLLVFALLGMLLGFFADVWPHRNDFKTKIWWRGNRKRVPFTAGLVFLIVSVSHFEPEILQTIYDFLRLPIQGTLMSRAVAFGLGFVAYYTKNVTIFKKSHLNESEVTTEKTEENEGED